MMVGVPMMPSLMLPVDPMVLLPMILSGAAFVKVRPSVIVPLEHSCRVL